MMCRKLLVILCLVWALGACSSSQRSEADRLFEATSYTEAAKAYEPLALADGADRELRRRYALSLARSGDVERAEPLLGELLSEAAEPELAAAFIDALALGKDRDKAWEMATQYLTRFPESAHVQRAAGTLAAQRGDIPAARDYFARSLSLDPKLASALANMGDLRLSEGDLMGAMDYYQQAVAIEPQSPMSVRTRVRMAQMLEESRPQEAITLIQEALQVEPHAPDVLAEFGKLMASIRLYDMAIDYLRDAHELGLERYDVLSTLGFCFLQRGSGNPDPGEKRKDLLAARMWLNRLLEKFPKYRGAHNNLGKVYAYLGDNETAEAEFRKELSLYPNSVEALTNLGRHYASTGDVDRARELLTKAFEVDRREVTLASELGKLAMSEGDWSQGLQWYKKALPLCEHASYEHPCHVDVPYQLARFAARQGDKEASVTYFLSALEAGFRDIGRFNAEPEFSMIKKDPRIVEVLSAFEH